MGNPEKKEMVLMTEPSLMTESLMVLMTELLKIFFYLT